MVEMDELILLTDPIFSARASPSQRVGPKRFRRAPCSVDELPRIDAVLVSHNHYDHLDYNSVIALNERFGNELRWFVPLGLLDWMQKCGCENVIELDWWEENCVPGHDKVTFVFTPSQHWCKRTLMTTRFSGAAGLSWGLGTDFFLQEILVIALLLKR